MVLILPPLHVRTSDQSGSCREEEEAAAVAAAVAAAAAEKEEARRAQEPGTRSKTSNQAGAQAAPASKEPFASAQPLLLWPQPLAQQSVEQLLAVSLAVPFEPVAVSLEPLSFPLALAQLQRIPQLLALAELQPVAQPLVFWLAELQPIAQPLVFQPWPKISCLCNNHSTTLSD